MGYFFNKKYSLTATSPTDIFSRRNKIVRKTNQKITDSFDVDIFSNPDEPPVVSLEDFELVDGKNLPGGGYKRSGYGRDGGVDGVYSHGQTKRISKRLY